jgi:RNA recognition motif-containing protein
MSSNRVYVGNLSWSTSWQDLKDHMRDAGEVQYAKVLQDRDGRSKGCGIVEFTTPEGAQDAISKLTDTELKGRKIFVREDREDGGAGGGGGGK